MIVLFTNSNNLKKLFITQLKDHYSKIMNSDLNFKVQLYSDNLDLKDKITVFNLKSNQSFSSLLYYCNTNRGISVLLIDKNEDSVIESNHICQKCGHIVTDYNPPSITLTCTECLDKFTVRESINDKFFNYSLNYNELQSYNFLIKIYDKILPQHYGKIITEISILYNLSPNYDNRTPFESTISRRIS